MVSLILILFETLFNQLFFFNFPQHLTKLVCSFVLSLLFLFMEITLESVGSQKALQMQDGLMKVLLEIHYV